MPTSTPRRFVWRTTLISLIWAFVLALDLVPSLRGDYGWRWPYAFPPQHPERLLWLALVLSLYCLGAWWLYRKPHAYGVVIWAVVGSIFVTLCTLYVTTADLRYELYARTASGLTTGGHNAAAQIDDAGGMFAVLRDWPEFARSFGMGSHVSTSPPGLPLIYYAADRLLEQVPALADALGRPLRAEQCHNLSLMAYSNAELASAWLGILSPLWVGLTALPLYWLGRSAADEQTARRAVLWWPLVPAAAMFTPLPSTVYPLLAVSALAMLSHGLEYRQMMWMAASGVTVSAMTFINLSLLPIIFLAGLLLTLYWVFNRREARFDGQQLVIFGFLFVLGLSSVWLLFSIIAGMTPWALFSSAMSGHLSLERPYLPWLILTLNDVFIFTGWPVVLLAGLGAWQAIRSLTLRTSWPIVAGLAITLLATLLAVDISGMVQGESGRILLYLSPLFLLVASMPLRADEKGSQSVVIITAAQAAMLLVMVGFVHVVDSGISKPPAAPPDLAASPQTDYLPSGALFDSTLRLERFAGHIETRQSADGDMQPVLILWLDWQSTGQVDKPYYLSFIPVAPDGQAASEAILIPPFNTEYPTTCWLPSSNPIRDRYEIPLFATSTQGDWWVSLSLVDGCTGEPSSVALPDGSQDAQVGIGPFSQG